VEKSATDFWAFSASENGFFLGRNGARILARNQGAQRRRAAPDRPHGRALLQR